MKGILELPGDKSISHRAAILASIAEGPCRISNFNTGEDCATTLRCLTNLGTRMRWGPSNTVEIYPQPLQAPREPLDCGNSGSSMRMLTGLLAGENVPATLIGDVSLLRRPMGRVAEPLRMMGALIELRDENYAPLILLEGVKGPIQYRMPISSAQVKSAVLFAGLRFPGTRVIELVPTRDHTERLLEYLRILPDRRIAIRIPEFEYSVPGDPSSAAFFVAGAILRPDSDLLFRHLLVNPHRIGYLRKLKQAGARIDVTNQKLIQNELVADVRVQGGVELSPIEIQPSEVPSLIDEIPALALVGTMCGMQVTGAKELRYKESDRIQALVSNFDSLGMRTEEFEDGFRVYPGKLQDGIATTFDDHRIAMTFAVAGMELDNPECVQISFPEFFDLINQF